MNIFAISSFIYSNSSQYRAMTSFKLSRIRQTGALALLLLACLPDGKAQTANSARALALLGSWSWTLFNGQCSETLQYRSDGVLLSTSGDAVTAWRYSADAAPSAQGFYKVTETSTWYNGKKDCYGDVVDEEGLLATRYIQLNPAKDRLIVCKSASLAECYGPLKRSSLPEW
jgi:hypothetical protein